MPEPYENIYIGTFILGLGYRIGQHAREADIMASVNLYQQTPGDPLFGDLLSSLAGKSTLIEFKRSARDLRVELEQKSQAKADLFSYFDEPSEELSDELVEVSRSCHFAGFGVTDNPDRPDIHMISYMDIEAFGEDSSNVPTTDLNTFHDQLLGGDIGAEHTDFLQYLGYLSSNSTGGGVAMLVVNLSPENKITILPVETIEVAVTVQQELREEEVRAPQQEAPQQKSNPIRVQG